jgi:hypothetical protein
MKYLVIFAILLVSVNTKKFKDEEKPAWAKKDIRDFTDADLERLFDQWEVSFYITLFLFIARSVLIQKIVFAGG